MTRVPLDTILRQRAAAHPASSAWVSANAGAGKTRVLTDRVVRLLLSGTPPARILCLTFTRAAAAEMTLRVFRTLGDWVTLDASSLADAVEALTGDRPDDDTLARARRLFARAVETPGGLKIETIHAFCERILHLVPFEAGISPRFQVLDDSQAGEMAATARSRVLVRAASGRDPELERALGIVGQDAPGEGMTDLLDATAADPAVPDAEMRETALAALARAFGLAPGTGPGTVRQAMLDGAIPPAEWPAAAAELRRTGKPTDRDAASAFEAAIAAPSGDERLVAYLKVFLTKEGKPRSRLATKDVAPGLCDALVAERERLAPLVDALAAAETLERTDALWRLADAVRIEIEAEKARLGALDFADLVRRTLRLLSSAEAAAWVLYKLDRGIDHVLVDEAQDTNADQWDILRRLTEEFSAGAGRPVPAPRTVFAVGDPKQSIYSFQGADPRLFEDGRRTWRRRNEEAGLDFADVRLTLSFRSAAAILQAVDLTFAVPAHRAGLSFDGEDRGPVHESLRADEPGLVEIWPTIEKPARAENPDAWAAPVDEPDRTAPAVLVAERVARAARSWIDAPDGAAIRPRDILVLLRSRGPAFFAVIRELKRAGIAVAGADRFDVGEHIAVNDLVAAGEAALRPENDLALAAALKSPLVGIDEDDLFRIAADRPEGETLAAALARHADAGDPRAGLGRDALAGWRALAERDGPFAFYARLLGPGGGRKRLVERLGGEAADAIDAFLAYAEAAEGGPDTPSLTGFLARFASADHTIKRDLDATGDEVRVMTVHGAKGLEAPVVVVIDGCETAGKEPRLVPVPCAGVDLPVWSPRREGDCPAVAAARERAKALRLEEHNRLLYVAMTRARNRLVIAPFAGAQSESDAAWCAMIRRGFEADGLEEADLGYGPVAIRRSGRDAGPADAAPVRMPEPAEAEPDWLRRAVPAEPSRPLPLRPSAFGRDRTDAARNDGGFARERGTLVHAAIEHGAERSPAEREAAIAAFVEARGSRLDPAGRAALAAEALAVLAHPDLAVLFGPGSRSEAALAGVVAGPGGAPLAVSGRVDRMAIGPDGILVADFKTGTAGDLADRAQLALYRRLLADAFPGRPVRALLVLTRGPVLVEPDAADLERALAAALA